MNKPSRQQKLLNKFCDGVNPHIDIFEELEINQAEFIDLGYEYLENGEYQDAFNLFSICTTINDKNTEILNGLGISLFEMGRLKKSRKILERAARLNPDDAITFANLAGVFWEIENSNMAIYYYSKSIELNPEIEETYINLINLYIETGALYMALITCGEYMKLFPEDEEAIELLREIVISLAISLY